MGAKDFNDIKKVEVMIIILGIPEESKEYNQRQEITTLEW